MKPALAQPDDFTEYIALDNPETVSHLVDRVFMATDRLAEFPDSGRRPPELGDSVYRELVVPPYRIFYRREKEYLYILYVLRKEQEIRRYLGSSE